MTKFSKELIESMQQAAEHAAVRNVRVKKTKQHRGGFAKTEVGDLRRSAQSRTVEPYAHLDSRLKPK